MGGGVVSFAAIHIERGPAVARTAVRVGPVTIYGLSELECARDQRSDFIQAWRDAICFELGSEEFEKFCLTRHKPRLNRVL